MRNFKDLPTDIKLEILTLLPTESILECKLVCRPWRNLVSYHPSFSRLHLNHLNGSPDSGKLSFLVLAGRTLHYFEYTEETPIAHSFKKFNLASPFTGSFKVIGCSFNGLVCLYGWRDYAYCICNPMTREYVMLPKINRDFVDKDVHWSSGFGFLPLTNEYKVVQVYKKKENDFLEVGVYTLGSGHGWRNVRRLDGKFANISVDDGVFVNEALHWRDSIEGTVWAFDLTEEKISEYISPPLLPQSCKYHDLGAVGGVLYYVIKYYQGRSGPGLDIWLLDEKNDNVDMKEQVEHKPLMGWRKEFSRLETKPLAFTRSGRVLCSGYYRSLIVHDPVSSTSKQLVDCGMGQTILYKKTLVSLQELGEEDIKIMESAEIEDTDTPEFLRTKLRAL